MLVASEEATAGSVIAKQERASPASSASSHSACTCVDMREHQVPRPPSAALCRT